MPNRHRLELRDTDALFIIDLQNDFCPGGSLAVAEGDLIVPGINALAARFEHVILTQDWHPEGHVSFASSHPGCRPYDTITLPYGRQTLWPDHCIQGSQGAALHAALNVPHTEMVLRKGFRKEIDSYSAFLENDHKTGTGLAGYLHERGLKRLFFRGPCFRLLRGASPPLTAAKWASRPTSSATLHEQSTCPEQSQRPALPSPHAASFPFSHRTSPRPNRKRRNKQEAPAS